MPVGSDSAGPSFVRHAVDQTPHTDTSDRHRLLLQVSDRIYAESLVTVDALLVLQSATGCFKTSVVALVRWTKPYVMYLLSSSAWDLILVYFFPFFRELS